MGTNTEQRYALDQTTGMIQAINEGGEAILISSMVGGSSAVPITGDVLDQTQDVVGHEVEIVSMDQVRRARPPSTSNRPSLLRRGPRTNTVPSHVTAYPPQISPSILSRYGLSNASASMSPTASYLSAQSKNLASSLYFGKKPVTSTNRNANVVERHSLSVGGGVRATNNSVEQIVIWQPDAETEDCEIVQVDEDQLQQFFQNQQPQDQEIEFKYEDDEEQTHEFHVSDGAIIDPMTGQRIIICGDDGQNLDLADLVGNYVQLQTVSNGQVRKAAKVSKRKLNTELKCQEEGCDAFVNNVIDLRKHLQTQHKIELDEENVLFANDDEFRTWRTNYERDRKVSFIYRGGTKKITPERAVTYLICHRSGVYKPTPGAALDRKRKMKPQGSCKIGTHCTAGVKLLKNLTNGTIDATICHTHYGHELENIQHLRVNVAVKEILLGKFDEGMSFAQVLQYVHHNPDGLEGLRVVDRRAIRNIYDQWKKMNNIGPTPRSSISVVGLAEVDMKEKEDTDPVQDSFILHTAEITETESEQDQLKESSRLHEKISDSSASQVTPSKPESNGTRTHDLPVLKSKKRPNSASTLKSPAPIKTLNELIHEPIENLLEHGESGPTVLYYKRSGSRYPVCGGEDGHELSKSLNKDEICVVLQTPVQRQLLQMFGKILYVDVVTASDLDILVLAVLDEFLTAIPVAWMIVSEISSANAELCFHCIKQNCVEVKCDYFYSNRNVEYYALWSRVFGKKPRLMLAQEDTIRDFVNLVKRHFDEEELRMSFNKELATLVTTPDRQNYDDTLKSIKLKSSSLYKALAKEWLLNKSQWAFHARLHLPFVIEESFSRLKKFVLFKGTKRLSRNIGNVLKIGYDRCFQRNKSLFKGDLKFQQLLNSIQANHDADLGELKIEQKAPNKYFVQNKYYVYDLHTECKCETVCRTCGVCAHRYWCTCEDNSNFCPHTHKVCEFSKPNWPVKIEKSEVVQPVLTELLQPEKSFTGQETKTASQEEFEEEEDPSEDTPAEELEPLETPSPRRSPKRTTAIVNPSETPNIPSTPEQDAQPDQRRISSRVKQKVARPMENEFQVVVHKRGRRGSNSIEFHANSTQQRDNLATSSTLMKPERSPKRQRSSASVSEAHICQADVKEEIHNLLNRIDSISDTKVLEDVKKRVTDIAQLLH